MICFIVDLNEKKQYLTNNGWKWKYYVCSVEKYIGDLEKEVELEYYRIMNRMSYDKVVMSHPEFSHITLPKKDPEYVPQKGESVSLVYMFVWWESSLKKHILPPKIWHSPQSKYRAVLPKGCVSVPYFAFKKNQAAFVFRSLLTKSEVICVLSEIWSECNKVANMSLFNITFIKPLRLEEFEVIQSQMHTQVL